MKRKTTIQIDTETLEGLKSLSEFYGWKSYNIGLKKLINMEIWELNSGHVSQMDANQMEKAGILLEDTKICKHQYCEFCKKLKS